MIEYNFADACVRVNAPGVIHETIDGEVIIINLSTGTYYSLKGSAAEAWELIEPGGSPVSELIRGLATRFASSPVELEAAVVPFLAELKDEGLIDCTERDGERSKESNHGHSNGPAGERRPFEPPALEKFTDMQDLVLLDPVHEVDQTGWPRVPDTAPDGSSA